MGKEKTFRAKVWTKAKEDTFGSASAFLYIIVFSAVVAIARLLVFGRGAAMTYLQEFLVDFVLAGGLFVIILFVANFIFRAPYIVGKEQQNQIEELETSFLYPDIKIEHLPITGKNGLRYASVLATNKSDNKIREFYGEIVGFRWINSDFTTDERVRVVNENREPVSVGSGSENGRVELGIDGGAAKFNIVIGDGKKLVVHNQKTLYTIERTNDFEIELIFRGEINDISINPIKKTYTLMCNEREDGVDNPIIVQFVELVNDQEE